MGIDEIIDRATIEFPKPLSLDETEELMNYIASHLPGNVHYTASYDIYLFQELRGKEDKNIGNVRINGDVSSRNGAFNSFTSQSLKDITDTTKIHSIRFFIIPGYDLTEHNPNTIRLWDDVRSRVIEYFKYEYHPKSRDSAGFEDDSN